MRYFAGPDGIAAGAIAEKAEVSASNVSFHLKELERAGLIHRQRESRSIIYTANYDGLSALLRFLMKDCYAGRPEFCAPAAEVSVCCASPKLVAKDMQA